MHCYLCQKGFVLGDRIVKAIAATIIDDPSMNCFEYSDETSNCEMHLACFRSFVDRTSNFANKIEPDAPQDVERTDILSVFDQYRR